MKKRTRLNALLASASVAFLAVSMCDSAEIYSLVAKDGVLTQVLAGENREKIFESVNAQEAIEWSMAHSPITVVSEGTYSLSTHISIPRKNISLVIAEGANLITEKDAQIIKLTESHGGYFPLIYNGGHDNVNVFNFGTLNPDLYQGEGEHLVNACIVYDGRCGGTNGISGGLIFSCGELLTTGDAVWIVDAEKVHVPLIWSRETCNALNIEGSDHLRLGTIAELNNMGRPKGKGRRGNEAIDLNSFCRNLHCELAIGTAPLEETVDINNSTDCIFEEVRAYGPCNRLFKYTTYKPHQRRLTQKSYIDNSEGTVIKKEADFRDVIVKSWKTDFQVENLLENLPRITVTAKLTGEFENRPTEEVLNKTYTFDL